MPQVQDSIDGSSTELADDLFLRNCQIFNINLKANADTATESFSRVEFNNHVSDQTINVYGGELLLGNDGRTRSTTPSAMLKRVNLTVYNTARVEAKYADSLGIGDNNILVTEQGYLNMQAGTLRNDVTADIDGILHIQEGVTIDSILTIKDSATVRGTAGLDSRLEHVPLGLNSQVNGQAIAMERGTIELSATGAIAQTTIEDYTVNYISVLDANLNIEESIFINIDGRSIAMNSVHNHDEGILFVLTPEPSTATLSLLALTGLLARRRRQQIS